MRSWLTAHLDETSLRRLRTVWHRLQPLSPWRLRRRLAFRRLNRGAAADEIVLRPGLRLHVDPRARESFEWFCFRSPEMVEELDAFLARSAGKRRFLDVGACHGLFSLAFVSARPEGEALAVEPSPPAYEILAANVQRQGSALVPVVPVRAAVGAAEGTLPMRFSWQHLEACTPEDGPPDVELPLRTLDRLCSERGFRPDLMKVDVEGYELAVLRGAEGVLREARPELFLEVHPRRIAELGGSMAALHDLLARLGYRIHALDAKPVSAGELAAVDSVRRFLCLPEEA